VAQTINNVSPKIPLDHGVAAHLSSSVDATLIG
jgi:hypothetical protein